MALVRPLQAFESHAPGLPDMMLTRNDILTDDDPRVLDQPHLFAPVAPTIIDGRTRQPYEQWEDRGAVEEATAGPGEKRWSSGTGRARK